jgi:hypothetical protein
MAFCMKCGASVEGGFCAKCGTPVGSPGGSNAQSEQFTPAAIPPAQPSTPATGTKKGRTVFWVVGGCLGLIIIAAIIMVASGLFFVHKAGLDPALMKQNPSLAVAKMMATMNPDIEVLSVDEGSGTIRVREKKTGKMMSMNLKDAQRGKIVFQDEQNKTVEIQTQGEGENASVEVHSSEGTMRMGTSASGDLPNWVPSYPGAKAAAGAISFNANNGKAGSSTFTSGDSVEKVAAFYENALNGLGFKVHKTVTQVPGTGSLVMVMAEDDNAQRNINVTARNSREGTMITLAFETKEQ